MARKRKLPPGMTIRNGSYHADFTAGGVRIRKRLSTDLDAAKTLLNQLRARADLAEGGIIDNDYPLADLERKYLDFVKQTKRPKTLDRYTRSLRFIIGKLGIKKVSQVRSDALVGFRADRLAKGISATTINRDVTILGAMLRWGVKHGLIGSNPVAGVGRLSEDGAKRGRALTDDEVRRLLAASPQPWRDIWYALLTTGMRRGELAALRFPDIDWAAGELVIRAEHSKTHKSRRIPIDAGLLDILRKQEAGRADRQPGKGTTARITRILAEKFSRESVFVTTQNTPLTHVSSLYNTFIRCCERAGIETRTLDADGKELEHLDLHSCRRTFATNLIAAGVDPASVQQILGHSSIDMTLRLYTRHHVSTKRQAIATLTYGAGAAAQPEGVLDFAKPVQNSRESVTETKQAAAQ